MNRQGGSRQRLAWGRTTAQHASSREACRSTRRTYEPARREGAEARRGERARDGGVAEQPAPRAAAALAGLIIGKLLILLLEVPLVYV